MHNSRPRPGKQSCFPTIPLNGKVPLLYIFLQKRRGRQRSQIGSPCRKEGKGKILRTAPPPSSARSFRCVSQDPRAKRILCRRDGEREVGSPQEEDPTLLPFPTLHFGVARTLWVEGLQNAQRNLLPICNCFVNQGCSIPLFV